MSAALIWRRRPDNVRCLGVRLCGGDGENQNRVKTCHHKGHPGPEPLFIYVWCVSHSSPFAAVARPSATQSGMPTPRKPLPVMNSPG